MGNELGDDGLPSGVVHRRAYVEQESEGQQRNRGDHPSKGEDGKDRNRGEHPGLPEDENAAAIVDVGGGAGEQAEKKDRQACGGLHEGDEEGRGCKDRHQPGAGCVLHPGADTGDGGGDPAVAEEGKAEGGKSTLAGGARLFACTLGNA